MNDIMLSNNQEYPEHINEAWTFTIKQFELFRQNYKTKKENKEKVTFNRNLLEKIRVNSGRRNMLRSSANQKGGKYKLLLFKYIDIKRLNNKYK